MAKTTSAQGIPTATLPSGKEMPVLGQGTWRMAEHGSRRAEEIASLRLGMDLGLTVIDTAEMYADGRAEELVGEAIAGRRDEVYLVSKVLPEHAGRDQTIAACERSLARLRTDRLDLYLLHWREETPLRETVEAFESLVRSGKILAWGVSNFDVSDLEDLTKVAPESSIASNQVLYNLTRRGVEWALMPWCLEHRIPIMAYSPIEQGRLLHDRTLARIAKKHGVSPSCIALAWVLQHDNVVAIPKAGTREHVRDNRASLEVRLAPDDLAELDRAFPPPKGPVPLETL